MFPVFESLHNTSAPIVAVIVSVLPWDTYLNNLLPSGVNGIYCILHDSCGEMYTYNIDGLTASFLGVGDLHDMKYDKYAKRIDFDAVSNNTEGTEGDCRYWLTVYPSATLQRQFQSSTPTKYAGIVFSVFVTMTITFLVYNHMVVRKNNKIITTAACASAIVSEIFPAGVKDRMLEQQLDKSRGTDGQVSDFDDITPIREVFPETTIFCKFDARGCPSSG